MKLLRFFRNAIIVSTAIPVALSNTTEENDGVRAMEAFQDSFHDHLQSHGEKILKHKNQVESHKVTFSGDGNTAALGTWKEDDEWSWSWYLVEVYRNNGSVWELMNDEIKIKVKKHGEGSHGVGHSMISLSDDGNTLAFEMSSANESIGNAPRTLQFYENVDGSWEEIHNNKEWQTEPSSPKSRKLSLDMLCADTLAPNEAPTSPKTDVPTMPPPPRGRSRTTLKVVAAGSCQPMEQIAQGAAEGAAIEGFNPGVESTPGEMMPRCGAGEGFSNDLMDIFLFIDQPTESCTTPISNDKVLESVENNMVHMSEKIHDTTGLDLEIVEVSLVDNPTPAPSALPSTLSPTTPEMRTFFIKSTFRKFNQKPNDPWCLQPVRVEEGAHFIMQKCEDKDEQKFYFDEHKQLRIRNHPSFCMRWARSALFLGSCLDDGSTKNKANFAFNEEDNTLIAEKPLNNFLVGFYVTDIFGEVKLFRKSGNTNDIAHSTWLLQYLSDTEAPSMVPTLAPSAVPSITPTEKPSTSPTLTPTEKPSTSPTLTPTKAPTPMPTLAPTTQPTKSPTMSPTPMPTPVPTPMPTPLPSSIPSRMPSGIPSEHPSNLPSISASPSQRPSVTPYTVLATLTADVQAYCADPTGKYPISEWNVHGMTSLDNVFSSITSGCTDIDLSGWNTSNVQSLHQTFRENTTFNGNISTWNTAGVTDMSEAFSSASASSASAFNGNLASWNTAAVTSFNNMFNFATSFNQSLSTWNTAAVKNMSHMFNTASSFNQNLSTWDTANVTTMNNMFASAFPFNQSLSTWNTANVNDMGHMFFRATSFNQSLSTWNTANVTYMGYMFHLATSFNQSLSTWNTANVTYMVNMFWSASSFNQDMCVWNWSMASSPNTAWVCAGSTISCGSFPNC